MRWFLLLILVISLAACGDDDPETCACPEEPWVEQDLPVELADGFVLDLAAGSGRLVGLGVTSAGTWVIEREGEDWITVADAALPGTAPPPRSAVDPAVGVGALAVDGLGNVLVAGGDFGGTHPLLWWAEPGLGWSSATHPTNGLLQDIVAFGDEGFVATGTSSTGFVEARGSVAGELYFGTVAVAGSGEAGLTSLTAGAGAVFGVGFDDGADGTPEEPYQIVMHFDGSDWTRLESPCGPCGSYEFRAVEASPDALFVGGSVVVRPDDDPYAQGDENAWLAIYSFQESGWTTIVLPEPARLERVNAILAASDGTIWLACGGFESTAFLVRAAPGEAPVIDFEAADLRFFALAEAEDGTVFASGLEATGTSFGTPVILERRN